MDTLGNDTLPDDAWKDSFDKLLDQRPILRELNMLKRDVRASFNMNSSYENSVSNSTGYSKSDCGDHQQKKALINASDSSVLNNSHYLDVPKKLDLKEVINQTKVVSTPIRNTNNCNPFKCTLSPIGSFELYHFQYNNNNDKPKETRKITFNATPISNNIPINVQYIGEISSPSFEKVHSFGISPRELVKNKRLSRLNQKQVKFADADPFDKVEKNLEKYQDVAKPVSPALSQKLDLQPGKWRKSLNCLRRKQNLIKEDSKQKTLTQHKINRSTGVIRRSSSLTNTTTIAGNRKSICVLPNSNQTRTASIYSLGCNDFKRRILQRCGQRRIFNFDSEYSEDYLRKCCKIGEGAFGEVFIYSKNKKNADKTVLKVIPIEGKQLVNGETQKTFDQILPEVIISMELSALNDDGKINVTSGYVNVQRVRCVKGKYPSYLQKLWEEYDLKKESENDHPKCFESNQIFIVLELSYGGQDLEGFHFKNSEQSFSALQQIILTLAVGEKEYQFEHRDLHWGNVLILNSDKQSISYKLDEKILTVPTKGIQITIIDYTLSRMTFNDYYFYNDLSNDEELFIASGDYQFEIYRMMRKVVNNKWEIFEPKTNIFWISYIISKLIEGVKYKSARSKNHLLYLDKLKRLQSTILSYDSCAHCVPDLLSY